MTTEYEHGSGQLRWELPTPAKILAYLGELRTGDNVAVIQLAVDLNIPHATAAMHAAQLESLGWVRVLRTPTAKKLMLNPDMPPSKYVELVKEWHDDYGMHPYAGRDQRRKARDNAC